MPPIAMPRPLAFCLLALLTSSLFLGDARAQSQPAPPLADTAVVTIHDRALHPVDDRLFGHFLERASWAGETGVEAAADSATGQLQPAVRRLLEDMTIPVLRFPGGTDVDHLNWTDLIDNAPDREQAERPTSVGHTGNEITNHFGVDEALNLAEDLGSEMILVLNFGECYYGRKPVAEAAQHAAGLIAYANAPQGASLPDGMPDWPAVRARNGRAQPWDVRYVQIANEPWVLDRALVQRGAVPDSLEARYFDCLEASVDAARAVDSSIEVIADGNVEDLVDDTRARLGERVDYVAYHTYQPWGISAARVGDTAVPPEALTDAAIWHAWVSTPAMDSLGQAVFDDPIFEAATASGYPVAVTEWNWNGWWNAPDVLTPKMAQGLGAAGFLHALLRAGGTAEMANQSMLVGKSWGITGIRVDAEEGGAPPHHYPTGQVTDFYARHHGDSLLAVTPTHLPAYAQPYRMNDLTAKPRVAYADVLAARRGDTLVVHAINRHVDRPVALRLDLSALGGVQSGGTHHVLTGDPYNRPCEPAAPAIACETQRALDARGPAPTVLLPPRSVSALELPLRQEGAARE